KELLLNIKQGFLTLGDFPPQFFDVIIMSDVIEHLRKPNELFELIKHYLKPDAIILIKTGNIDSLYAKICGRWWGYFGSWEHISFFSPRSIEYLLKENNLKLNDIYFVPHFSGFIKNLKSVVYSLTVILVKNLIKSALNKFFQKNYKTRQLLIAYDHIIVVSRPSDLT
ncbi:MAG: class I SAM-dependent methyltransferase, partial [Ignavibacteriaceae bacterium]|nr:class I SAM-dependent methyltransferase [Ignavibacteriaceae bacterium]